MSDTAQTCPAEPAAGGQSGNDAGNNAATVRLTDAQRRYLERGLTQPGGKLPLFDRDGREVPHKTVDACIAHGWAERWVANPINPNWRVCRLTEAGYRALGQPAAGPGPGPDGKP
jgi:hypothetical protein